MTRQIELTIDVSEAAGLGEPAHLALGIHLPDPAGLSESPIVCFARPGGGYSRHYFTHDLPGPARGAQAGFHAARGWIFVAMDHLGCGGSSLHDGDRLDFSTLTRAAFAAEQEILARLANGVLTPGYPPVLQPVRIGMGQSTGGLLALVQQAHHGSYDGLALLGASAVHNHPPTPPGEAPIVAPWYARDRAAAQAMLNADALARATAAAPQMAAWTALAWAFHHDDVPAHVVERELAHYEWIAASRTPPPGSADASPWMSFTTPQEVARFTLTPGAVAPEAAAITVPVLSAMGERDLVVDPPGEARAFRSAPSFDLFVCPGLGHMHNFGGPRALFWERIHAFGQWCAAWKRATG